MHGHTNIKTTWLLYIKTYVHLRQYLAEFFLEWWMFRTGVAEVMNTHTQIIVCHFGVFRLLAFRVVFVLCGRFREPEPKACCPLLTGHRDCSSKTGSPRRTAVWILPATGQAVGTRQATDAGSRTQELWKLLQSTCAHSCVRGLWFEHASFCLMNFMGVDGRMLLRRVFEGMMQDWQVEERSSGPGAVEKGVMVSLHRLSCNMWLVKQQFVVAHRHTVLQAK